jgi:hypothetical protein
MKKTELPKIYWMPILAVAAAKLILHLVFIQNYGFHRDELLYMALGQHPAFGYWSNPPLLGWLSALVQNTLGGHLWSLRLVPALVMSGVVILTGLMAREMKGGRYAQFLAAFIAFFSPAFLRIGHMFMPVSIDIAFWTLYCWLLLRYLNTENLKYILYFGAAFGLGMLNKYSVGFFMVPLVVVLLFSQHRDLLWKRSTGLAALLALLVFLPNLIWQFANDFPVIIHMTELKSTQLVNINIGDFLKDQLLMNAPSMLIWLAGLFYLLFHKAARGYRVMGWLYLAVLMLFILLKGKSYYTLGMYPVLMAAGAVFAERLIPWLWLRALLPLLVAGGALPLLPVSLPIIPIEKTADYFRWVAEDLGLDGIVRWEDGRTYTLPQDYADMLGWKEIADLVKKAYELALEKNKLLIYAENYGQAGAIAHFYPELPDPVSFSDTYRLWAPRQIEAHTLIYVNDELGQDVADFFGKVTKVGEVNNPISRQHGDMVFLCEQPKGDFPEVWASRVSEVMGPPKK